MHSMHFIAHAFLSCLNSCKENIILHYCMWGIYQAPMNLIFRGNTPLLKDKKIDVKISCFTSILSFWKIFTNLHSTTGSAVI